MLTRIHRSCTFARVVSSHRVSIRSYQVQADRRPGNSKHQTKPNESSNDNHRPQHMSQRQARNNFRDVQEHAHMIKSKNVFQEPWPDIDDTLWRELQQADITMKEAQSVPKAMQLFDKILDSVSHDLRLSLIVQRKRVVSSMLVNNRLDERLTEELIATWFETARMYPKYKASHCMVFLGNHDAVLLPSEACVGLLFQFARHQDQRLNRALSVIKDCWIVSRKLVLNDKLKDRMRHYVATEVPQALPELNAWFALCQNILNPRSPCLLDPKEFYSSIVQTINDEFYIEAASALTRAASMKPPVFMDDTVLVDRLANSLITACLTDRFKLSTTTAFCELYNHKLNNMLRLRLLLQVGCVPSETGPRLGLEAALLRLDSMDLISLSPEEDAVLQRVLHQFMLEFVKQKRVHLAPSFINLIQSHGHSMPLSATASLITAAVNLGRSTDALLLFHYYIQRSDSSRKDVRRLLSISLASFVSLANEDALRGWIEKAAEVELRPTAAIVRSLLRAVVRLASAECSVLLLEIFSFASSSDSSSTITSAVFDDFLRAAAAVQDVYCTGTLLQFKQEYGLPCSDRSVIAALAPFAEDEADHFIQLVALLPLDFLFDVEAMVNLTQPLANTTQFCDDYEKHVISLYVDPLIQLQLRCTLVVVLMLRRNVNCALRELRLTIENGLSDGVVHEVIDARLRALLVATHRKMRIDEAAVIAMVRLHVVLRELGFSLHLNDQLLLLHDAANIAQSSEATRRVIDLNRSVCSSEWDDAVKLVSETLLTPLIASSSSTSTPSS